MSTFNYFYSRKKTIIPIPISRYGPLSPLKPTILCDD